MSRYTIKKPEMLNGIETARFKPKVIIACLISLAIYLAYNIVAVFVGIIYIGIDLAENIGVLQGGFDEMLGYFMNLILSQTFIIITLFSTIVLIGFVIIQVRAIDKRKLKTIGLSKHGIVKNYIIGIGFGALVLLLLMLPMIATEYNAITYVGFKPIVVVFLFAFIIQSAAEEILFRGYLLTTISNKIGVFWAVMVSSAIFALLHIINPGMTVLTMIQVFLLGAFFGFYVVRTNNIWGACGMHFAWNFLQGAFANIEIAGVKVEYAIITFDNVSFEPEAGNVLGTPADLIPIAILLAAIAVVLFVGKNKVAVNNEEKKLNIDKF